MEKDYFASELLNKLAAADPIHAAYEAQAVSRDVGFDFADFQDVVPRALDEISEAKEAFTEGGWEGHEHFGDELADIMFSLINLARHADTEDMTSIDGIMRKGNSAHADKEDTISIIDTIGSKIEAVAEAEKADASSDFVAKMNELFESGMIEVSQLAEAHGFDTTTLLRENVRKYLIRCQAIEQLAERDNKQWSDLAANNEIVTYWKKAKILLE